MVVVGAVVLPHGSLIFDGSSHSLSEPGVARREGLATISDRLLAGAENLHNACLKVSGTIEKLNPDLLILHTPHGIHPNGSAGIILNKSAEGNAEWNGEWLEYKIHIQLNQEKSRELLKHLEENDIPASGVICFSSDFPSPLRWGQVVPLWFVENAMKGKAQYIIVNQILPRNAIERESLPKQNEILGKCLYTFAEHLTERVLIVISGDLSHMHSTGLKGDYPLYQPDPCDILEPDEENAKKFDDLIERWALSGNRHDITLLNGDENGIVWNSSIAKGFLQRASDLQPKSLSCGLGGFQVLHGLLEELQKARTVQSNLHINCAPTYYGMMVATFIC